jgi:hypothetical protein
MASGEADIFKRSLLPLREKVDAEGGRMRGHAALSASVCAAGAV